MCDFEDVAKCRCGEQYRKNMGRYGFSFLKFMKAHKKHGGIGM